MLKTIEQATNSNIRQDWHELLSRGGGSGQRAPEYDLALTERVARYGLDELPEDLVHQVMVDICRAPHFAKSKRNRELLRYLVEKSQAGQQRELTEYAIGIQCFGRDPRSYSTGEDPIVRVQIGRLRERLKQYYDAGLSRSRYRLSIPLGSYIPQIEADQREVVQEDREQPMAVCFFPLQSIGGDPDCVNFTHGLNEELGDQLFRCLDQPVCMALNSGLHPGADEAAMFYLEGSVRYEGETLKIALRIIHTGFSQVLWSQQVKYVASQLNT